MTPEESSASVSDRLAAAWIGAATARYRDVNRAVADGYVPNETCSALPGVGGMGYHYVNTTLLDDKVDVAHPEALLYEPGSNGQLNLVAVEYVIPKAAWTSDKAPTLFGKDFKLNAFDLWALHVWVWENNPSGLYADWNPRVSCANAS